MCAHSNNTNNNGKVEVKTIECVGCKYRTAECTT